MTEAIELTYEELKAAVAGNAAAFRCMTEYQPVGGPGDKVFPPTYKGGKYAVETRMRNGQQVPCVLLDSVQSQANRMEMALLGAYRSQQISIPILVTNFDQDGLKKKFTVTSLEAPHRVADAIFRDCLLDGVMFRKSEKGKLLDTADVQHATGLFGLCPTALIFGIWDSTGPRGGLGAKFQRALVSEIIGINAQIGVKTSSRIDPAQIMLGGGPLYKRAEESNIAPTWTLEETNAQLKKSIPDKLGKDGKPSEANHGNVTPSIEDGGFTIEKAIQTTVLSLAVLRRLKFPLNGVESKINVDLAGRTVLASLGLAAATFARSDADLRSRCQLFPQQPFIWELLDIPGKPPRTFNLNMTQAIRLVNNAINDAKKVSLPWDGEIKLIPHAELVEIVRKSQELASIPEPGE